MQDNATKSDSQYSAKEMRAIQMQTAWAIADFEAELAAANHDNVMEDISA